MAILQGSLTLFITLPLLMFSSAAAWSAFLGGSVSLLPNMATGLYWSRAGLRHQQVLRDLVIGEGGKWLLTLLLFTLIFWLVDNFVPLAFFGTFLVLLPIPVIAASRAARRTAEAVQIT